MKEFIEQLKASLQLLTFKTRLLRADSKYKYQIVHTNLFKPLLYELDWDVGEGRAGFVFFALPMENAVERDAFVGGCEVECPHGRRLTAIASGPNDGADLRRLHERLAKTRSADGCAILSDFIRIRVFERGRVVFDHTLFELEVAEVWDALVLVLGREGFCHLHERRGP